MASPSSTPTDDELLRALDEQIQCLPEKYRTAVVLCELQGRTIKQVAQQTCLPEGTVASRLHRGRAMLAKRMKLHRANLSAAAVSTLLADQASATVPNALVQSTAKVGAAMVAGSGAFVGVSISVAQLTQGVLKLMLLTKIKTASSVIVTVALVAGGGWALHATAMASGPRDQPAANAPADKGVYAKWTNGMQINRMQRLWKDLAGQEDTTLIKAVLELAAGPKETVSLFQAELRPIRVDPKLVEKWIADVNGDKPEAQAAAAKELDLIAPLIKDQILKAVDKAPDEDARQRLRNILLDQPIYAPPPSVRLDAIMAQPTPGGPGAPAPVPAQRIPLSGALAAATAAVSDGVHCTSWKRAIRAITILEHIGTPEAQSLLTKLAEGDPEAAPTKAAKEAVGRIKENKNPR